MKRTLTSVILAFAAGCAPQPTIPPSELAPVRLGMVMSLSGSLGEDGNGWSDAAHLAVEEINAAGGPLPGRLLELVPQDDATDTDPAHAMMAAQAVVDQGVVAIVGAAASSISINVAMVAEQHHLPQISCCSTSDNLTMHNEQLPAEGRFFFRTAPPDILQSKVVAIAAMQLACTHLAILHLDDDYGTPFGAAIETNFRALGGGVVINLPFHDGNPSYATEVTMIRDAAPTPDCIALVAFSDSAGTIVRDWSALSGVPAVTWIGTDGIQGPGFVTAAGDPALIDNFYGSAPITNPATPQYARFSAAFNAAYGHDPVPFAANNYDATALLALAIAQAGSTDGDMIRDALFRVAGPPHDAAGLVSAGDLASALEAIRNGVDVDYQGASGNTDFDEVGNVVTPYEIWRYDSPASASRPCPNQRTMLPTGSFCRFGIVPPEDLL